MLRKLPIRTEGNDWARHTLDPAANHPVPWHDGIAIVGMSLRFPQSENVEAFWQHLLAGDDLIADFTDAELRSAGVDDAMLAHPRYVRRGTEIDKADRFDAEFFGLSPREAEIIDPQHRIFLECAWEALENSGHTGDGERVGVFAGAGSNSYGFQVLRNAAVMTGAGGYQVMIGNEKDFLASRVAYKLNLRGPAVAVQTACSTSLAAVHLACRSLLDGECDMALAGGVSIAFPQRVGYEYIPGMIFSPDGHCRPFEARAQGTAPGRGAGVVVLKPLRRALADCDSIVAVIRGSAWNNDGDRKVGYTAPSIDGQAEVIRAALRVAAVSPGKIGYVEAHGTATELGDSIEIAALSSVYDEESTSESRFLGAVKANMGHTDCAAGVAGLIKTALVLKSGTIPPCPQFEAPNPLLALEKTSFVVNQSASRWPHNGERWAGVSSFAIGGTNVHAVVSQAPVSEHVSHKSRPRIFPVSARTASALENACTNLALAIEQNTSLDAADISFTLQVGRRPFSHRRAVVARMAADAAVLLRETRGPGIKVNLSDQIVFLFPGQGQDFDSAARGLYAGDHLFRRIVDEGCDILRRDADLDLLPFFAGNGTAPGAGAEVVDTAIAQPLLFLIGYGLAERWRSLGAQPSALLGHSLGEFTAACYAGVFSFEDGLSLAARRGSLMQATAPGRMLAVMLEPEKIGPRLGSDLWLAAENGPRVSIVSGTPPAVEELEKRLSADRIAFVRLPARHAFHSPAMANAAKTFRDAVASVPRHAPRLPWLSNVTGTWIEPEEAQSPQYWGQQILSRVRFRQNLDLLKDRPGIFIAAGPGEAFGHLVQKQVPGSQFVESLERDEGTSDETPFLCAVAKVWEAGVSVDWKQFHLEEKAHRVPLPTYPFERRRYWVEPDMPGWTMPAFGLSSLSPAERKRSRIPQKREDLSSWFYIPSWQSTPPAMVISHPRLAPVSCWIVLADESGVGSEVTRLLEARGHTVFTVSAGAAWSWDGRSAAIDPLVAGHYQKLWRQIEEAGLQPEGVLNLWALDSHTASLYDAFVLLMQSGGASARKIRCCEFVTASLESVAGEPIAEPLHAELHGLAQVIPHEYPGAECRCIDLQLSERTPAYLAQQIVEEVSTSSGAQYIAYRKDCRWQKKWIAAPLQEAQAAPLRSSGTYLITGGLGGIGYVLARHLLSEFQANVILTGRSHLPPDTDWDAWISSHGPGDPISTRIARMRELQSAGGRVIFEPADVTDAQAMEAVFNRVREEFGSLHGVIHAAGIGTTSLIAAQDLSEAELVRSPKIRGACVLAELLRDSSLDFLLFCSSIATLAPAAGQSAYAAANAFLNTFSIYARETLHLPALAICLDTWQELGMAAELDAPEWLRSYNEERLQRAISNREGIEVVSRALTLRLASQILVSTVALEDLEFRVSSVAPAAPGDELSADVSDSKELAEILEIWKEVLSVEKVGPHDNFFVLGGHSLMGIMMMSRIRERLGVSLPVRDVFESPTPAGIAELVRAQMQGQQDATGMDDTERDLAETVAVGEDREEFEF